MMRWKWPLPARLSKACFWWNVVSRVPFSGSCITIFSHRNVTGLTGGMKSNDAAFTRHLPVICREWTITVTILRLLLEILREWMKEMVKREGANQYFPEVVQLSLGKFPLIWKLCCLLFLTAI